MIKRIEYRVHLEAKILRVQILRLLEDYQRHVDYGIEVCGGYVVVTQNASIVELLQNTKWEYYA